MGKPGCDMALRYPLTSDYAQVEPDLRHTTGKLTAERYFAKQCCVYLQSVWGCSSLLKTWFAKTQIPRQPTLSLSLMNICIYIYTYIRTHTHTYTYIHTYVHTYPRTHTYTYYDVDRYHYGYSCTHTFRQKHSYALTCVHAHIQACMHPCRRRASQLLSPPARQPGKQTDILAYTPASVTCCTYVCLHVCLGCIDNIALFTVWQLLNTQASAAILCAVT